MSMKRRAHVLGSFIVSAALVAVCLPATAATGTEMVDVEPDGTPTIPGAGYTSISKDGTLVAFTSRSDKLVEDDRNGAMDVFVRNMVTGITIRVSLSTADNEGNNNSFTPVISGNGRYVAFASDADNLVTRDNNGLTDVFRRDLKRGRTVLVSSDPITKDDPNRSSVNGVNTVPAISYDGKLVGYVSTAKAKALVAGEYTDRNGRPDVFVRKWTDTKPAGFNNLVSHRDSDRFRTAGGNSGGVYNGTQLGVTVSDDGNFIAFGSTASNLDTSHTDTNGQGANIFWADRGANQILLVDKSKAGVQGDFESFTPSLSADGCDVAFWSTSGNLISTDTNGTNDIFVKDLCGDGEVLRANLAADGSQDGGGVAPLQNAAISDDGNRVTFASFGVLTEPKNCGGEQVYVRKFDTSETVRISDTRTNQCGERWSNYSWISGNGKYVTWISASDNLVLGDANGDANVFYRPVP
jgi:hypothetical protein